MTNRTSPLLNGHESRVFLLRLAVVVVCLHLLVGGFGLMALWLGDVDPRPAMRRAQIAQRIAPVAEIATSPGDLPHPQRGATASHMPLIQAGAERVVDHVCAACHSGAMPQAPRIHDHQAWSRRLRRAGNLDALVQAAIEGSGMMPPRGGAPRLRDEQIRDAIEWMRR